MKLQPPQPSSPPQALSEVLAALAADGGRTRITIADLLLALDHRAVAALMFVFAFPNVLPTPPGTSSILGAPLLFLAAQLMLGLRPWLPAVIANRSIAHHDFAGLVRRIHPWLVRAEQLLRPRLSALAMPPIEYAVGALCLVLAVVLVLPVPLGNMLPALAICLVALGILGHDGLWVLAGVATGLFAAAVASGVIYAMVKAAIFVFNRLPT